MARRTVLRSKSGKKLYAVRTDDGKFKDIQSYAKAHAADLRATSKEEIDAGVAAKAVAKAKAPAKKTAKKAAKKASKPAAKAAKAPAKKATKKAAKKASKKT